MSYPHDHNRQAWDAQAREGKRFTRVASADDLSGLLRRVDRLGWLGESIAGQHVLCLGAGGGRHGAVYASCGARVTVVDISGGMLELDRKINKRFKLDVRLIQASMDYMPQLLDAEFDLVIQPVSTCYLADLQPVYAEISRVTKPAGLYVSQHKQPGSLQGSLSRSPLGYEVVTDYYHQGSLKPVGNSLHREEGMEEFLHKWEDLLGLMCRAGFVIEDVMEPKHGVEGAELGSFEDRSLYLPPYVKIKARRQNNKPIDKHGNVVPKGLGSVILP